MRQSDAGSLPTCSMKWAWPSERASLGWWMAWTRGQPEPLLERTRSGTLLFCLWILIILSQGGRLLWESSCIARQKSWTLPRTRRGSSQVSWSRPLLYSQVGWSHLQCRSFFKLGSYTGWKLIRRCQHFTTPSRGLEVFTRCAIRFFLKKWSFRKHSWCRMWQEYFRWSESRNRSNCGVSNHN